MSAVADITMTDTRSRIRAAALSLIASRGYEAVSMRDIAERVGVRPSAIYNHFDGKQAILTDLMTGHMERTLGALFREVPAGDDPVDRLAAFVRFHVGYHLDEPQAVFVAYMELRSLSPEGRAAVGEMRDRYEHVLQGILREGSARGAFRVADPRLEARALIAMMTGVTVWFSDDGSLSRAEVVERYVDIVLRSAGVNASREEN